MKEIITKDKSITFYNEEYKEHYHSVSGAIEEARKKYIEASPYKELAIRDNVLILDVCFGLGYNSAAAIDKLTEINKDCRIVIVGLENDPAILEKASRIRPLIRSHEIIRKAIESGLQYDDEKISLRLELDDARQSIKRLQESFDLVFHDPFSPKKCPELWTEEFFRDVFARMKKGGVLTTYSCAKQVRESLRKAGFIVSDGPCVGRRAPSTIARK